jgi:hypothetical protein
VTSLRSSSCQGTVAAPSDSLDPSQSHHGEGRLPRLHRERPHREDQPVHPRQGALRQRCPDSDVYEPSRECSPRSATARPQASGFDPVRSSRSAGHRCPNAHAASNGLDFRIVPPGLALERWVPAPHVPACERNTRHRRRRQREAIWWRRSPIHTCTRSRPGTRTTSQRVAVARSATASRSWKNR